MLFSLFCIRPDLAPKKFSMGLHWGSFGRSYHLPLRAPPLQRADPLWYQRDVLSPDHARRYFYSYVWYCALRKSSRIQFRRFSPSNSPLTLPLLVWVTEYGTGQLCLNIFGQAVSCVWAPDSKNFNLDTCYWLAPWFRNCLKLYSVDLNISLRRKGMLLVTQRFVLHIIFDQSANIWNDRVTQFQRLDEINLTQRHNFLCA